MKSWKRMWEKTNNEVKGKCFKQRKREIKVLEEKVSKGKINLKKGGKYGKER